MSIAKRSLTRTDEQPTLYELSPCLVLTFFELAILRVQGTFFCLFDDAKVIKKYEVLKGLINIIIAKKNYNQSGEIEIGFDHAKSRIYDLSDNRIYDEISKDRFINAPF